MESIAKTMPRAHVRVGIEKNSKGYNYDTTVSLDYDLPDMDKAVFDPSAVTARANALLAQLLDEADVAARAEIADREATDREGL